MGNCQPISSSKSYDNKDKCENDECLVDNVIHAGSVLSVGSTRGSGRGLACSDDCKISVFSFDPSIRSISSITYLTGHSKAVNRVIASSSFIWSVSRDLSLRQWTEDGRSLADYSSIHSLNISAVTVTQDEALVCTGSRDYSVKCFDVSSGAGEPVRVFQSPRNVVTFLSCHESLLFQGSEDLCVRVWDTRQHSSAPSQTLSSYVYFPLCGEADPAGRRLVTGCKGFNGVGCEVKLWDLRAPRSPVKEFVGLHQHDVTGVRLLRGGSRAVSVCKDGSLGLWSLDDLSLLASSSSGKMLTSVSVLSDNEAAAVVLAGAFDGSLVFFSVSFDPPAFALLAASRPHFQDSPGQEGME